MQNLKIPRGILHFILSHAAPVSWGRCNQIQRDYFGSPPLLRAVISHYSWTTAVNSLLPASSHGWSICTTSATWSRRHELMLVHPLAMWPQFPFGLFPVSSHFFCFLPPCSLSLLFLSLSVCGCVWVCWCVSLGCPVCQGNMTGRKFPQTLSLPLITSRCTHIHSAPLESMQHVLWVEIIWKMVHRYRASTQFGMRWNNLMNGDFVFSHLSACSFISGTRCDGLTLEFSAFPLFPAVNQFPQKDHQWLMWFKPIWLTESNASRSY